MSKTSIEKRDMKKSDKPVQGWIGGRYEDCAVVLKIGDNYFGGFSGLTDASGRSFTKIRNGLWGDPGEGKTTAVVELYNEYDGVFVRATRCMTVNSMLGDVCIELGGRRASRNKEMLDFIVTKLRTDNRAPRPVFVDEADYCLRDSEITDTLRDIYDLSGSPVILIGMEDIARRLRLNKKVARRVTQWMEFKGLDLDDTRIVAESCAEVAISEDLLQYLHAETGANIGRIIIGLTKIEKFAFANRINEISCASWGDRPLYFDQPIFTNKNGERAANAR